MRRLWRGARGGGTFGALPAFRKPSRVGGGGGSRGSVGGTSDDSGSVGGWSAHSGRDGLAASTARRDTVNRSKAAKRGEGGFSVKARRKSSAASAASKSSNGSSGGALRVGKGKDGSKPAAVSTGAGASQVKSLGDLSPEEAAFALSYSTAHVPDDAPVDAEAVAKAKAEAEAAAAKQRGDDLFAAGEGALPPSAQAVLDRKKARAAKGGKGGSSSPKRDRRLTA